MTGVTDLDRLIASMNPALVEGSFVFCTIPEEQLATLHVTPHMVFRETEGVTVILRKGDAVREQLTAEPEWALITLTVHSSLQAVGFLARITAVLAGAGLSVNPVSAYYHDHLFVPYERRADAMHLLNRMRR